MASDSIALTPHNSATAARSLSETVHSWVTTVDHKRIGVMYIGMALLFLVIGGIEATIMRIQLALPNNDFVSPQVFNRMFTMHGTTMIFFVAMPILFGFGNYAVPLMIGARDMAFPRLNAFSFWITLFGGLLLYFSFVGGFGLTARATRQTSAGSPTRRSPRKLFRPATAPISGRSASSSPASAASAPRSTWSPQLSACAARA